MINSAEVIFRNTLEDFISRFPKLNDNYKNLCEKQLQQMKDMLEDLKKNFNENELESNLNSFYSSILELISAMNMNQGNGLHNKQKSIHNTENIIANDAIGSKVSVRVDNIMHKRIEKHNPIIYDTEIEINSLLDVEKGWNIKKTANSMQESGKKVIVGFVGLTRSGKTFVLSKLNGLYNPNDILEHTKGIGFLYNKNDALYIDSSGIDHRLKELKESKFARFVQQLKARDFFLQSYTIYCSKILILVFNDLSSNDQKMYNIYHMLIDKCKSTDQLMVVIHNLKDFYSIEAVYSKITNLLEPGFNLQKKQFKNTGHYYYEQDLGNNKKIIHLIMVHEGSDAGNLFNPQAISFLSYAINTHPIKEEFNSIGSFLMFSKQNLKNYIDMVEKEHFADLLDNSNDFPIQMDKNKIQGKKEFSVTNFLIESFGGVIDKLHKNNLDLDFVIMKEEKYLLVFVYIPNLQENTLKITAIQQDIIHYTLIVEGKRCNNGNNNNFYTPGKPDSKSIKDHNNYEDFQVIIGVDVNCKFETDMKYVNKSYKQSILMIKIAKIEEKRVIFSSFIQSNMI